MQGLNGFVSLSPDGENVLSTGAIYNLRTKQSITLENPALQPQPAPAVSFTRYSSRGTLIAVVRLGSLYLLDSSTGKVVHLLFDRASPTIPNGVCNIFSATFSPDEGTLAASDANGNVSLWNVKDGELQGILGAENSKPCAEVQRAWSGGNTSFGGVGSVAYSPDGSLLASGDDYGVVRLWQISSRSVVRILPFHVESVYSVGFSPDGRFLLTTGFWREPGQVHRAYLIVDPSSGRLLRAVILPGFGGAEFTSDGNLLIGSVLSGRIRVDLWSLPTRIRIPFTSPARPTTIPAEAGLLAAYEERAVNVLQFLQSDLGSYRSGGEFPHSLQDLAKVLMPQVGEIREGVHGYKYTYTPGPADAQGNIASYVISARPLFYEQTGKRSFLVDQTGQVHATEEAREATTSDAVFRSLENATEVAAAIQNAAAAAAQQEIAPHLARAQMLFQQRQYRAAIAECDAVLHLDPSNQQATNLKSQIQQTMSILGVR